MRLPAPRRAAWLSTQTRALLRLLLEPFLHVGVSREKIHYVLPQSINCERFIVTLNVILIMMRVFCTVMTFCLSRLKLRPGLLSPFAHALTQTVCKMYHAYYVLLVLCIHKPFYFQLCLHGALTGYLCWPSTPHLLYEAAVVKFYCTAACCVRIDRNNLDAKESP